MQSFFLALDGREPVRDAEGIARAIGRLVTDGELEAGDKLPPIRTVATHLGVSSSTVAAAWSVMRRHGLIHTDRRRGTTVRPFASHGRNRYWQVPNTGRRLDLDLSTGTPDPELVPPLEPILAKVQADLGITSYLDPPVLPDLDSELRRRWPYDPPALTVVDGANDGLDRVIASVVRLGDVVVVEDPTYPMLLDQLELAGAEIVGVALDDEGPRLDELAQAIDRQPAALVIQTGGHNPTGTLLTRVRAKAIAKLVAGTETVVIEDDHLGAVADDPVVSLGSELPDQVFRIQSYSKTYGPDLRVAAVTGPVDGIDTIQRRRQMGPGWTSRLIQRILLELFADDAVGELVAEAAQIYSLRRHSLGRELNNRDVQVQVGEGLNLWVPVGSEQLATVGLAAEGIGVSPGAPFRVQNSEPHIRVTATNVRSDFTAVADAISAAAHLNSR
ncbi:MAG: aminotransferase class I/II-fold pyridoxal phosphate-dependent enzyme [Acidimicrobiia bacterium]|nr:aminotransferase class I/II-fold pyridoxal phosphate-dependent enzyme [Acidimicrobiia bacterium]